jgi:DNA-binding GntR family transcriptional regulator
MSSFARNAVYKDPPAVLLDDSISNRKTEASTFFHLIQRGKLKRGDQLPTERELVDTFKVSRASVREAIFYLEAMNLVQRRQGNGTYVIASNEEALVHIKSAIALDSSIALYHFTLGQIYRATKDIPGALREFQLAESLEPGNSVLHSEMEFLSPGVPHKQ